MEKIIENWLNAQHNPPEPKENAEYTIGLHIGSDRWHEKSAYCLMEMHNEELTIIGFGESRNCLKSKVEEIAQKYNAKILTQK